MIAASNNNLELVKLFKDLAPLTDCNNDTALDYALNCGADAEVAEFLEGLEWLFICNTMDKSYPSSYIDSLSYHLRVKEKVNKPYGILRFGKIN